MSPAARDTAHEFVSRFSQDSASITAVPDISETGDTVLSIPPKRRRFSSGQSKNSRCTMGQLASTAWLWAIAAINAVMSPARSVMPSESIPP